MKIHEYQAKEIFSQFAIPVPRGSVADDADEARKIAEQIGGARWVVKAQVHAGGRGKGGGVRVADTPEAVAEIAEKMFESHDCTLVEINPLAVTEDKRLLALDAKIEFDDNALYRHKDLLELKDTDEQDPLELEASRHRVNYIRMEGDIGIMVNGAGLAMATMDLIKQVGANPANFLDVGGGATTEMVTKGFEIILQDKNVRGILINIFGGILRCDVLAKGVVDAAKKVAIKVPVVVRLEGTNVEQGRKILADSDLDLVVAHSMADAAEKVKGIGVS